MKRLLKSPALNAVCVSMFTAFYSLIFIGTSGHKEFQSILYYIGASRIDPKDTFWGSWSLFLADGHHQYIAYAMIALTVVVVVLLLTNRRPYDEYHVEILITCLVVALILIIGGIALFYLAVFSVSNGIVEKFTLFIVVHWACVVLSDLAYVLLCRRK
jgi:hypothetical protein